MVDITPSTVAPWLEGLDEAWEEVPHPSVQAIEAEKPKQPPQRAAVSQLSRIPRRSPGGPQTSAPSPKIGGKGPAPKRRSPLATLSSSDNNTIHKLNADLRTSGNRSVSEASDGSVVRYSTVQQRAKSSSPVKQGTLEWKKRLLHGQVGYGDQTELFGPSGLDNIFANPQSTEQCVETRKSWLDRSEAVPMPSSPPPWPASYEMSQSNGQDNSDMMEEDASESSVRRPRKQGAVPGPDKSMGDFGQDETVANRTIGGQTELDQEDFSPVFISKHTTLNGQVDYKAVDSNVVKQLQSKAKSVSPQTEQTSPLSPLGERDDDCIEASGCADDPPSDISNSLPDFSLSENLPVGTPPVAPLSSNVELKRGGHSQDGSFRHRALSSSRLTVEQVTNTQVPDLLPPLSTSALQLPQAPTPPQMPVTPAQEISPPKSKSRSSGSPLKLFGPHDTFTNNRLLRRMSQLDPDISSLSSNRGQEKGDEAIIVQESTTNRQVSSASFGNGELDRHPFDAEITITSATDSIGDDSDRSPGSEVPAPGSRIPLDFRQEMSPVVVDTFKLKRGSSKRGSMHRVHSTSMGLKVDTVQNYAAVHFVEPSGSRDGECQESQSTFGSGKRPPTTPGKDSTPKRRRTLHVSEIIDEDGLPSSAHHDQLQRIISGRKRKDARKGDDMIPAEPDVLAQRKILRPRSATPSQRQKEQTEAEIRETAEEFVEQEPERLKAMMEQIESSMLAESPPSIQQQARVVANEVAKFSLRVQKASGDQTERKRSVTTQDFFDEAVMVMRLIREKAGRQSVLGSVAESDQEALGRSQGTSAYDEDLSSLRISRPPSREGGSGWRPRSMQQTDMRVLSHLRKFQEKDDTDFIADSIAVLDVEDTGSRLVVAVDEQANIRISGPHPIDPPRGSVPGSHRSTGSDFQTQMTQNSAGPSTGRTAHTSSTRKSENVGTLAPDAVAHLIGDHVGGMIFDKEKQQWIRSKPKTPRKGYGSFLEPLSTITSDDDPFREISDLPVDMLKEEEIRRASCNRDATDGIQDVEPGSEYDGPSEDLNDSDILPADDSPARAASSNLDNPTSDPSNTTSSHNNAFESSQQQVETRATSWSDEELQKLAELSAHQQSRLVRAHYAQNDNTEVEAGIDVNDSYVESVDETGLSHEEEEQSQSEVVEDSVVHHDSQAAIRTADSFYSDDSVIRRFEPLESPRLPRPRWNISTMPPSLSRTTTRQVSLRRKTLTGRLNTDAMEQSELSFVAALPGERKMTLSLSLSRPVSGSQQIEKIVQPTSPAQLDPSFLLSDLPDFTINEEDHERPSERRLAQRLAQHAAAEVNDRFACAVKDLVKTLTDVQAEEPFWEDLRQLDLHGRSLNTVHGLDEFCARIQDVDLSNNSIAHLTGAPTSIRQLNVRSNLLCSLTSWTHLVNLQYLDISNNQIDDLAGLGCLVHLRELRADDNKITSLSGIQHLDGLLKLRVRRNRIMTVDFERATLGRLEELDLQGNQITSFDGLESLLSLEKLRLDENQLQHPPSVSSRMNSLKHLSLRDCNIDSLDVANFPTLRSLDVDGNCLSSVQGINQALSLDLLSMRRQILPDHKPITILSQPLEARALRLSGNSLPTVDLSHPHLSLQTLELSSCGLRTLPDDFGLRLPNLKTLNLNFNSLKDIRPLLNIQALEVLSAAGNLLSRLRKTTATLSKLPTLRELDLRDNPLTQGFHAPRTSCSSSSLRQTPALPPSATASLVPLHRPRQPTGLGPRSVEEEEEDLQLESAGAARYLLPDSDASAQHLHVGRLEEGLALRRRVWHLLLAEGCPALRRLDGEGFDKGGCAVKDGVWERLEELGVVRKKEKGGKEEGG